MDDISIIIITVSTVTTIIITTIFVTTIYRNFNFNQLKDEQGFKVNNDSVESNQDFDYKQLKFERGFKFNNNSIESADNQAFEIDIDQIKLDRSVSISTNSSKCEFSCDVSCKRSLMLEASIKSALDWFSASLGISRKTSEHEHEHHKQLIKHSHDMYTRAELKNLCFSPTKNYIKDIEDAVKDTYTTNDKIQNLRKVSEKYGHFYARHLFIGGAIIKDIEYTECLNDNSISGSTGAQVGIGPSLPNNSLHAQIGVDIARENVNNKNFSNSNRKQKVRIIGGNELLYDDQNPSTLNPWIESLKNPITWKIIGYKKFYALFELLDEELQKKVLKALAGVDDIKFNGKPNDYKPSVYSLSQHISEINNIDECQIFASIVSEKDHVFSLYVDYEEQDITRPLIVVHHIQWNKPKGWKKFNKSPNNFYKAILGWIIVGLPTSFDFKLNQHPLTLRSGKYQASASKNFRIVEIPNCRASDLNETCILGTCELKATIQPIQHATSRPIAHDPYESKIIIGTHFNHCNKSACLFAYDIKDGNDGKELVYNDNVAILQNIAVDGINSSQNRDYGQMYVKWEKSDEKISYGKNIETSPVFDLEHPVLVNQLFDKCDNCQYHGFVNIINSDKVNKVIYGTLNSIPLTSCNERIAFLSIKKI
ncbi:31975_t:CDS:2 [Gigaspora margarita]|uniref:31975_t:CDS:1 n=1 Tax=Gigaspora margarita TaxID=4874 RepID=A0ABN7UM63_GIGMA|nr:31975_t:CDS:2 [Gigaspora margarita]